MADVIPDEVDLNDTRPVELIDGPCKGPHNALSFMKEQVTVPLNDKFHVDPQNVTIAASHTPAERGSTTSYRFRRLQRLDGQPVKVMFVGGPYDGQSIPNWQQTIEWPIGPDAVAYEFSGTPEPIGLASYEWQSDENGGRFAFLRNDDSEATRKRAIQVVIDFKIRGRVDSYYANPDGSIYEAPREDQHKQVRIRHGEFDQWEMTVDEGIAPLINQLRKSGFDTLGSCEDLQDFDGPRPMAYIWFPFKAQREEFCRLLDSANIFHGTEVRKLRIVYNNQRVEMLEGMNVLFRPKEILRIVELVKGRRASGGKQ